MRRLDGDAFIRFLTDQPHCSVCFVDDGSTDDTAAVLEGLHARLPERVHVVKLKANVGKAEAVRQGVMHVRSLNRFAVVGYWDADLSTPLAELQAILLALELNPDWYWRWVPDSGGWARPSSEAACGVCWGGCS